MATVVDFIYGIGIPEDYTFESARSLLAMADLYLMEDLKDAVGSLIASKQTRTQNILEIAELAEKHDNKKLKEMCCQFVFQNLDLLDKKKLAELCEVLPMLRKNALLELQQAKGRPNNVEVVNKVFGVKLTSFKKRVDFKDGYRGDDEYKDYVMTRIEPDMIVLCSSRYGGYDVHDEDDEYVYEKQHNIHNGTIGRVISVDLKGPTIKWTGTSKAHRAAFYNLDLLTPPIVTSFFKD